MRLAGLQLEIYTETSLMFVRCSRFVSSQQQDIYTTLSVQSEVLLAELLVHRHVTLLTTCLAQLASSACIQTGAMPVVSHKVLA